MTIVVYRDTAKILKGSYKRSIGKQRGLIGIYPLG